MRVLVALLFSLLASAAAFGQQPAILKVVSTASGSPMVAPNSLVSIYGANLTTQTASANGLPWPNQLAGVGVVVDGGPGSGFSLGAVLAYASPTQINFVMPAVPAGGTVNVRVVGPEIIFASGTAQVQQSAPALFTADGSGSGVAAAIAIRVVIPTNIQSTLPVFTCGAAAAGCQAVPLDLGVDAPLYLVLFGTGIRGGSTVTATIGGVSVPVAYAGAQPQFPGLDQVNLPLNLNLRGLGSVNVVVTVDGQPSNPVVIDIQ